MRHALRDAASFLTDDEFGFEFTRQPAAPAQEPYFLNEANAAPFAADEVILFSGDWIPLLERWRPSRGAARRSCW